MKVLLVDDHTLFREGLALLLRPLLPDLNTREAGSCEEALQELQTQGPVDLVLMDLELPGMSGLQGITSLRQQWPDMPVVALSSADDRNTVLRAIEAGAMGFVPKSATSAVLVAALRLILARGIYLPASVLVGASAAAPAPAASMAATPPVAVLGPTGKSPAELGLSPRQSEVLYLILQGKPAKLIEREMKLLAGTVKAHTSAVLRALNVTTRTQAVLAAGRLGLMFGAPSGARF
jgi:DNA-binding NarL/FixJ family response regulator